MSLNWKEIDVVLDELRLDGAQIQKATQSSYDALCLTVRHEGTTRNLLIILSAGACRFHETFRAVPKSGKPLRFAEFVKARLVNGIITEARQLGDSRVVRLVVSRRGDLYYIYVRLWANAANVVVTTPDGTVLDAMRRRPKKGEVSGGVFVPPGDEKPPYECAVRPYEGSFNAFIDTYYAEHGAALSLESLRAEAERRATGHIGKVAAALENLRAKEAAFADAESLKERGDALMAALDADNTAENLASARSFYDRYRKAKSGLAELRVEIAETEAELALLEAELAALLACDNPLQLAKMLEKAPGGRPGGAAAKDNGRSGIGRPGVGRSGIAYRDGDWLILVGRSAAENDALLRRHVKGNDLWLHARDTAGAYVFVKQRAGKSVPLDILLDAGNLALFYSKGRANGKGSLYYTPVKYLRRAKAQRVAGRRLANRGLVIPTQEKNLDITLDDTRLRRLEKCRVD